ncbi:hypothetical protein JCM30237_11420 [Halolamina litorea]|uniref:Response regulator n=1 Tax=Halolamina litorea TaxID=1515593 RepID=A0ABD6BL97_9EURY|nr:response regulator [Halolamina litorea]
MGSNCTSVSAGALADTDRVVIVGDNQRNAEMMGETLAGVTVATATPVGARDRLGSGPSLVDAVVVDTETVTRGVTELVRDVREQGIPVVLLSGDASPSVRRNAAGVDGMAFEQKPIRSDQFRELVADALA